MCNKVLCIGMIHTLKTDSLTKATSYQTGGFQQIVVTLQKKFTKNNEWTDANATFYAYSKEYWALFQLFSGCYDNVKGRQLQLLLTDEFFPLQNMYTKKRHENKKGKNSI